MVEKEKACRIMNELLVYFLSNDIVDFQANVQFHNNGFRVELQGNCSKAPADMNEFAKMLRIPRNPNMEDYYDELLGTSKSHAGSREYHLLGMMIDDAQISYEDFVFKVSIYRRFEV